MTHAKLGFVAFSFYMPLKLICADGLPGEYLLSNKWRQVFANQSPVDNPAMIMEEPYLKVRGRCRFLLAILPGFGNWGQQCLGAVSDCGAFNSGGKRQ